MTTAGHRTIPPRWRAVVAALCVFPVTIIAVLTSGTVLPSVPAQALACPVPTGVCQGGGIDGDGVDLWRGITNPGSSGTQGSDSDGSSETPFIRPGTLRDVDGRARCRYALNPPSFCLIETEPGVPAYPSVSMYDLRHVIPQVPQISTEPLGWTIRGLPANLLALIQPHVVTATVLSLPAEVSFTPVSYAWHYGDGGVGTTDTAGAPWAEQGLREFSVTPTSHAYRTAGTYWPAVTVSYAVAYRFNGQSWRSVSGTLEVTSAPRQLVVTRFDRALVEVR